MELEILYEDASILVAYKPAGIAVETGRLGEPDMVSLLRNIRAKKGESSYIGLIHRLDQPVEGVMVFGKTKKAAADLSGQIMEHSLGKYYYAIGQGTKDIAEGGTLEHELLFDRKTNLSKVADKNTPGAKHAVLHYEIIEKRDDKICFAITLQTGRHHQIRVQLAHMGYPLLGDRKYGRQDRGERVSLALCAYRLCFVHPDTKKEMDFVIHPRNPVFAPFLLNS